jgi:hypothetical protein
MQRTAAPILKIGTQLYTTHAQNIHQGIFSNQQAGCLLLQTNNTAWSNKLPQLTGYIALSKLKHMWIFWQYDQAWVVAGLTTVTGQAALFTT